LSNINVSIPVELTQSMIIRRGVVADEARALELAVESHDIIAKATEIYRAKIITVVDHPVGPDGKEIPDAEPIVVEGPRPMDADEIADFQLAAWRVAVGGGAEGNPENADGWHDDGRWVSMEFASLAPVDDPEEIMLRWTVITDVITGSNVADMFRDEMTQ
jgi:hypothetical protein